MPRDKKKVDPTLKAIDSLKKKVKTDEPIEEPKKKINKEEDIPPNNVLFVKNVPSFVTNEMLIELFKQYPGFKYQNIYVFILVLIWEINTKMKKLRKKKKKNWQKN